MNVLISQPYGTDEEGVADQSVHRGVGDLDVGWVMLRGQPPQIGQRQLMAATPMIVRRRRGGIPKVRRATCSCLNGFSQVGVLRPLPQIVADRLGGPARSHKSLGYF